MDKSEIIKIGDDLIESVKDIFPADAEYDSRFDGMRGGYVSRINWKLNNDETRPNKPARIILIIISEEAVDDSDYWNHRLDVQQKFYKEIKQRYVSFVPVHN